jgi:hypothetical protein
MFLLENGYVIGSVDKTLFTLKYGTDFLLVQIYVDYNIFSGSSHALVFRFQEMMKNELYMSMMGELSFFLGIQIKHMKQGTFVYQAKYTKDLMKKFNIDELKHVSTLMSTTTSLDADQNGEAVDQRKYKSMIGSLMYLTVIRPNIQFTLWLCAGFRLPHALHIERQFSKFLGTSNTLLSMRFGILLLLRLILFAFYANFIGCGIDRKSTSATCHFFGSSLVCWSSQKQSSVAQSTIEAEYVAATPKSYRLCTA